MTLVDWNSTFSVRVKKFDEHHQLLVAAINRLHDAMLKNQGRSVLADLVDDLTDYTKFHFTAEEELLGRTRFPGLDAHRSEHQQFIDKMEKFKQELAEGKCNPIFVFRCLTDWLTYHIKKTDQEYSAHLNVHGVS